MTTYSDAITLETQFAAAAALGREYRHAFTPVARAAMDFCDGLLAETSRRKTEFSLAGARGDIPSGALRDEDARVRAEAEQLEQKVKLHYIGVVDLSIMGMK